MRARTKTNALMLRHPRSANQNGQDTETRRQPQQEDQGSTSVTSLEKGTLSGKYAIMCKYYYYCTGFI